MVCLIREDMRKRIIVGLMLVGFLLFVSCKSSLYDLCPNLFSKADAVKAETHLPSCHKIPEAANDTRSKKDCECPLVYQDYTLGSETIGKLQTSAAITASASLVIDSYFSKIGSHSISKYQIHILVRFDANRHFINTVRLLI